MEIQGKIIAVLPLQKGISKNNGMEWHSQEYVIETQEQYPHKCCFRLFGKEKISQFNINIGEVLCISFDIDAHEYNGRWYNNFYIINVIKIVQTPIIQSLNVKFDDLPFEYQDELHYIEPF